MSPNAIHAHVLEVDGKLVPVKALTIPTPYDGQPVAKGMVVSLFWCPAPAQVVHPPILQLDGRESYLVGHITAGGLETREGAKLAACTMIDGIFDAVGSVTR